MTTITRTTDPKGRVSLPKAFANATVIIEQVSDVELRIRKARIVPEDEVRFREESPTVLSKRDWERFLDLLDHPPPPNDYLRQAVAEYGRARPSPKKRRRG
jgi:hypothetical protein